MQEFKPFKEGKVREVYDNGDSLIMVATTRSRIILEGMAILNGITTLSRIIIFKVTIVSKAIIHSGIVNIK